MTENLPADSLKIFSTICFINDGLPKFHPPNFSCNHIRSGEQEELSGLY